ncbi:MAG: response regulator [Pseudomonadota bacterium]
MNNVCESPHVFLVEDERQLALILSDYLARDGFECTWFEGGEGVVDAVRRECPALMLLDLMLPGKSGLEICRDIRAFSDVPIIMVTARVEEIDRLIGLEMGADDYVCKPFSPREVVARVKAVLRRTQTMTSVDGESPTIPGLVIDAERLAATLHAERLDLTRVEFRLLAALAQRPGHVLSRAQLVSAIYDDHRVVSDRTVDSHIKNLRRKLDAIRPGTDMIVSVYGVGYRIEV